ncbi:MAG: VWA domain-containing protein [Polyangiaceae bacterium]
MRLTHLVGLSFVCMFSTSAGVWALTPADAAGAEAANVPLTVAAPEEEPQAVPVVSKPGTLSFEARLGHQQLPSGIANRSFVSIEVSAPDTAPGIAKQPLNLAIAIDRSGSMKGVRLTNAVNAARAMVQRLRDGDAVSLVSYNTQTEILADSVTIDGSSRQRVMDALDRITAQGDTCISCGLEESMRLLQKRSNMVDRILLLSDGQPTSGLRSVDDFRSLAARSARMDCAISSIGIDVDYNEKLLIALATGTNGRHHFAEQAKDLAQVFDTELASLQSTVADAAEVELKLAPGVRLQKIYDRAFRQEGDRVFVSLGSFATKDVKTVLAEVEVPAGADGTRPVAQVNLAYTDLMRGGASKTEAALSTALLTGIAPRLDPIVEARVARAGTADSLTRANVLFGNGDVAAAKQELRRQIDDLSTRAKAPAPARAKASLESQLSDLKATQTDFEDAELDAPAPKEAPKSRDGKAGQKKTGGRVISNRL